MFAAHNALATAGGVVGDPYYSQTKAILHFDSNYSDTSALATSWLGSGSVSVSSTQSKFGGSSLSVSGGYLYNSAASSNYVFGTSDFTAEMWVYMPSVSGNQTIFDTRPNSNGNYFTTYLFAGFLYVTVNSTGNSLGADSSVSTNTWTHVAVCRTGGYITGYVNGVKLSTPLADTTNFLNPGSSYIRIGTGINGFNKFSGYIDDVRITTGTARYTATFTPPTDAFPDSA